MTSSNEDSAVSKKSDFSIEHILTKAGTGANNNNNKASEIELRHMAFSWLNCTRYCPPKLPRNQKREGPQKRQLGRHPRIPFSSQQLAVLEEKFKQSPYLSSAEVTQLSRTLQLADIRVKIWFQNRRARERREKNEQETQLKPTCTITNEVNVKPETTTTTTTTTNEIFTSPLVFQLSPTSTTTTTINPLENNLDMYENYRNFSRYVPSQYFS